MIIQYDTDYYSVNRIRNLWEATNIRNFQTFSRFAPGVWTDVDHKVIRHDAFVTLLEQVIRLERSRRDKQHKPHPARHRPTYAPLHRRKPLVRPRNRKEGNRHDLS